MVFYNEILITEKFQVEVTIVISWREGRVTYYNSIFLRPKRASFT